MNKVTLNIDSKEYIKKPTGSETGAIQKRIGTSKTEMTVQELAEAITSGRTFKAAALNGNKNTDWESQQVFCLDIDNDDASVKKYGLLTPIKAYGRFVTLGLAPAFYYESFSSTTEKPKFRMVFILEKVVDDVRIRNVVQMALMTIMPEADSACKDLSRIFYGSNKPYIAFNIQNTICPYNLVQGMIAFIKLKNENPKDSKKIKNYCQSVGLNMVNGLPDVRLVDESFGISTGNSIIYNIEHHSNMPKKIAFNFNVEKEDAYKITVDNDGKKKAYKHNIENVKKKKDNIIEKFDFDTFENKCELWADFINGTKICKHNEIFSIACSMWRVKGAESRMLKAIEDNDYKNAYNKLNTIKSCRRYGYAPRRCEDFCEYYSNCPSVGNIMLYAMDNKRGSIRAIEDVSEISLEEAEIALTDAIHNAYNEEDKKVYVIKAPTGIGKTTALNSLYEYSNLCIAYPNHRLGADIVERLDIENSVHVKELVLEDEESLKEFRRLQSVGAYKQARAYLENYSMKLIANTEYGSIERDEATKTVKVINEYLEAVDKCKSTTNTIFCTHKRMLTLNNSNINKYIIDEDIMLSSLVQTVTLKVSILDNLIEMADKVNANITKGQLMTIKEKVLLAQEKPGQAFTLPVFFIKDKEVNSIIEANKNNIDINLKEVIKTRIVTANTNKEVLGINIAELPNKKCIILSATANEVVYRSLLRDREVEFIDLGNVKTKGKLILHYTGFSRSTLNKNIEKAIDKIRKEASGIDNIITFAKYKNRFKEAGFNTIAHFGACSGLDGYKGENLIVAGTPHVDERVYFLLAAAIKENIVIEQGIEYINVRRNGFEFSFNTYNSSNVTNTDTLLQEIQFYIIETELIQAVGRARILRTEATVHLFSNYPLKGAILY